jgi:hypothetical protein
MKCVTHHQGCACREEKVRRVATQVLEDHLSRINGKWVKCDCETCEDARFLLGITWEEEYDEEL